LASRVARCRSGWNSSAMATAAAIVSTGSARWPTNVPMPNTMAAYTAVTPADSRGDQQGAADDHVDVEQPAAQDRDRHGHRDGQDTRTG
jgi:hypothetical protein